MAIEFECPSCDATIRVKDDAAGKKGRCPKCKTLLLVPDPGPPDPEPPALPPAADPEPAPVPEPLLAPVAIAEEQTAVSPPVPAPGAPFAFADGATSVVVPTAPRRRPGRSASRTVSAIAAALALSVVALGAWLLYRAAVPDAPREVTGERLRSVALTPVTLAPPERGIGKEDVEAVTKALARDGLMLKSEYVDVALSAAEGPILIEVNVGPQGAAVRVPLAGHPAVRDALEQERDAILKIKREELRGATTELFREYFDSLAGGPRLSRLHEHRDRVALNATVDAAGYAVEAVVRGAPLRCVYEDSKGDCYFFPPKDIRRFQIRGRTLRDGSVPLPVELDVVLKETVERPVSPAANEEQPGEPPSGENEASADDEADSVEPPAQPTEEAETGTTG